MRVQVSAEGGGIRSPRAGVVIIASCLTWMLGIELNSFARTVCALKRGNAFVCNLFLES